MGNLRLLRTPPVGPSIKKVSLAPISSKYIEALFTPLLVQV